MILFNNIHAQVTDVDGQTYKTVKIGNQIWLAENLNVSHFRNGDPIMEAKTNEEWIKAAKEKKPAWCYYNNDTANGKIYGKLYNWYAVTDYRGLAPEGWHIPSSSEWAIMMAYLGGSTNSTGQKIKATEGWIENGNSNNSSGFTALPGGFRNDFPTFAFLLYKAGWWTITPTSYDQARYFYLENNNNCGLDIALKSFGFSVRCIKD